MATERKIKCPYCSFRTTKDRMITHIDRVHSELIPEGYTAARVLFNYIHHKDHGTCVVCKRPTPWDEKTHKYKRLCGRPECKRILRERYRKNMIKVFGTDNILNDDEQQKKMLAGRRISGEYQFRDGTIREYTGTYEKKLLEFLDQVIGFDGDDIITPGPTFEYEYKGEKHIWITDCLIVPYNLVLDVKDGGHNPNNRSMVEYRAKQVAKEKMITNLGTYNYLRLTDNQFEQLITVLYQLKSSFIDDSEENKKVIISINEEAKCIIESINALRDMLYNKDSNSMNEVGGLAAATATPVGINTTIPFVVQYNQLQKPTFAVQDDIISDNIITTTPERKLVKASSKYLDNKKVSIYKYKGKDTKKKFEKIFESVGKEVNPYFIYETLSGRKMLNENQIEYDPDFEKISLDSYIEDTQNEINMLLHKFKLQMKGGI